MKKLALHKVVTLVAALALGSACIANDALARGGGGGGGMGGGFCGGMGDGGFGGNGGGHVGGSFAGDRFHDGFGRVGPFLYGDYGDYPYGANCWESQRVRASACSY